MKSQVSATQQGKCTDGNLLALQPVVLTDAFCRMTAELQSLAEGFALTEDRVEIVILDQGAESFGLGMKLDKRMCAYVNSKMPSCFVMGVFGKSGFVCLTTV